MARGRNVVMALTAAAIGCALLVRPGGHGTAEAPPIRVVTAASPAPDSVARVDSVAPVAVDSPADSILHVDSLTRLLVVAPHPDDEVLGAGGLIEHVREMHGDIRVVYLTDGEGYRAGAKAEGAGAKPTATEYYRYGRRRQREARSALRRLGVDSTALVFLGFPTGLNRLMSGHWSEQRAPLKSPFTGLDRPPRSEVVAPHTEYRGDDLTRELGKIMDEFQPTMVVAPRAEDQHVDHCGAWFFTADALTDVERRRPERTVDLLTYIIHHDDWPFQDVAAALPPPPDLSSGVSGWLRVPLTPGEVGDKRAALHRYSSQMKVMAWFLDGFARSNEVFARMPRPHVVLPVRANPCDAFVDPHATP